MTHDRRLLLFLSTIVTIFIALCGSLYSFNTVQIGRSVSPYTSRSSKPKIAVVILTHSSNHKFRLAAVLDSWAADVSLGLIVTDKLDDTVQVQLHDRIEVFPSRGPHSLGQKAIFAWTKMCSRRTATDADFVIMVDDDTLINVPVLQNVMGVFSSTEDLYAGFVCTHRSVGPFASGGAGILLSASTFRKFCHFTRERTTETSCSWESVRHTAGDVATCDCFTNVLSVNVTHIDGFLPVSPSHYSGGAMCNVDWFPAHAQCDRPPPMLITAHYVNYSDMRQLYFSLKHAGPYTRMVPRVVTRFGRQTSAQREAEVQYEEVMKLLEKSDRMNRERRRRYRLASSTNQNLAVV